LRIADKRKAKRGDIEQQCIPNFRNSTYFFSTSGSLGVNLFVPRNTKYQKLQKRRSQTWQSAKENQIQDKMTASTIVRSCMDKSVGATLCSKRQRSLSGTFEYGDLKWYNFGDEENFSPLPQDIYDIRRSEGILFDNDEDSLFNDMFNRIFQCQSQDQSRQIKQKRGKFSPYPSAQKSECCDITFSPEIPSRADLVSCNMATTALQVECSSIESDDLSKLSSTATEQVPCLFSPSKVKTGETICDEDGSSSNGLASEEDENLLTALYEQSLAGANEVLSDICPSHIEVTSVDSVPIEAQHDDDDIDVDLQKYIAIANSLVLSTLTSRERALHRYHRKRKRRNFLRRNKKKSKLARLRSRKGGRFTSIYPKCRPNNA